MEYVVKMNAGALIAPLEQQYARRTPAEAPAKHAVEQAVVGQLAVQMTTPVLMVL